MAETLTHWKKLSHPDYIGAYELMENETTNKDLVVKIEAVRCEIVTGPDGKKEECTIMTIPPHKPMILNATNKKMLAKLFDTPFIEKWSGKQVTIYVAKVKAFGDTVDALRIRPELPNIKKPQFGPDNKKWQAALDAIVNGTNTIGQTIASIESLGFELSPENKKLIESTKLTPNK